jgi:hypothetical protein
MRDISIDDEVFAALQARAIPLVDDTNSVLRRLLGLDGAKSRGVKFSAKPESVEFHDGRRDRFRNWVLEELFQKGGSARAASVLERIRDRLQPSEYDLQRVQPGIERWRKDVHFARLELKNVGLIEGSRERGEWRLTQAGMERARLLKNQASAG